MSGRPIAAVKRAADVLGHAMAYLDVGGGDPIIFIHGNPTSSYAWRHVIPHLESVGRCIAPDLIGMGDSDKLEPGGPRAYRFVQHRQFLDALLSSLDVRDNVTFVGHEWGGALAFDWANRHRSAVRGIAYMETIVRPLAWAEWPERLRATFQRLRSAEGDGLVLRRNLLIEQVLPASVVRDLTRAEMKAYRAAFKREGEGRRSMLTWVRELPIEGRPDDVVAIVDSYARWMATNDIPKLFVNAQPGSLLVGDQREFCRSWPNQREVTVPGVHLVPEDCPDEIGSAVAAWYRAFVR
jgi:haloalkane dehalogenase